MICILRGNARAGKMAQLIKCFLHKHNDLSWDPSIPMFKLGMCHVYKPRNGGGERQNDPGDMLAS